jgi:hypothetical protein
MRQVLENTTLPAEGRGLVAYLTRLFSEYGFRINRMLPKDGSETMTGVVMQPYATGSFTVPTGHGVVVAEEVQLTGTQEVILEGDAALVIA